MEHLYRTLREKAHLFTSIEECVRWYNELKPHLSLDFERAETPIEAHARKMPKRPKRYAKENMPKPAQRFQDTTV
ncbi:MAG: hypothetical protein QW057_05515 [Candidatus Bathyarchaeia archaeon]